MIEAIKDEQKKIRRYVNHHLGNGKVYILNADIIEHVWGETPRTAMEKIYVNTIIQRALSYLRKNAREKIKDLSLNYEDPFTKIRESNLVLPYRVEVEQSMRGRTVARNWSWMNIVRQPDCIKTIIDFLESQRKRLERTEDYLKMVKKAVVLSDKEKEEINNTLKDWARNLDKMKAKASKQVKSKRNKKHGKRVS